MTLLADCKGSGSTARTLPRPCGAACGEVDTDAIRWATHDFLSFDASDLYEVLRLRQQIFIVEQNVAYADIDGIDPSATHLLAWQDGKLAAYMRLLPAGLFAPDCFSFGRVVVERSIRRSGIGTRLVEKGLERLDTIRGYTPIRISSQLYLRSFYADFGFASEGEPYVEDQLLHIAMVRA